ncbi:MAG TPA: hypothetical protein DCS66_11550, partial [Flavobacteriaceae bacterium]|nr:hypothetical protein [Flavobacteriaceae bacterium]
NNSEENTNNINNVSNQNIDVPIRAIDNPDLNNREFKNKRPSFKSNKTYNDTEITTEITKKAAAEKREVLEKRGEEQKQEEQKMPSKNIDHLKTNLVKGEQTAAAFSFSEKFNSASIDGVIGDSLNDAQKRYLLERASSIMHLYDLPVRDLCIAIQAELLDKNSFKASEQQFVKKLNIIIKQTKNCAWHPVSILNALTKTERDNKQESLESDISAMKVQRANLFADVKQLQVLFERNPNEALKSQYDERNLQLTNITQQIQALEAKLYATSA